MTTLNVNLTDALKTELSQDGVYLQVLVFENGSADPLSTTIYTGGSSSVYKTIPDSFEVSLGTTLTGGKVYFLIQSVDPGANPIKITQQSEISWESAQEYSYRYDSFEVTLQGSGNDAGNLTSVEGFGLPMDVSIPTHTADGTAYTDTRGYKISGSELLEKLSGIGDAQTVWPFTQGPLATADVDRGAISPSLAVGSSPSNPAYSANDWSDYIASLEGEAASKIALSGFFNGAKDANGVYHNGGFYSYELEWDASENVFWLSPTETSQIKGYIKIDPTQLADSIYSTLGYVQIYENKTDAKPYIIYSPDGKTTGDMNTGLNNQWGKVLSQFLTGFTAGFYGVEGESENPDAEAVDLNKNWNWDPTYSFGSNLVSNDVPVHKDPYSEIFFYNSNSYGSGYSDSLMSQYSEGGPLISVYDPYEHENVSEIDITLYSDSETPAGYIQPVINNYLAPDSGEDGHYVVPVYSPEWEANQSSITLNFANSGVVLKADTPIYLEILTGYDASGKPVFAKVQLGEAGTSPWQLWNIKYDPTTKTYSATADSEKPQGSLIINQFPTAENGTSWYRIVVGDGDAAKTFNLYVEADNYKFVTPTSSDPSLAIDGLAVISPGAPNNDGSRTLHTFTINFAAGATLAVDPSLAETYTDFNYTESALAAAPVAGTLKDGVFEAVAGQTDTKDVSITVQQSQLAFGWTGLNSYSSTATWIGGVTNKIMAGNTAQISIKSSTSASYYAPMLMVATADVDGQWQTGLSQQLGNGIYEITMTEYAADDTTQSDALTYASNALKVQVDLSTLPVASNPSGSGIAFQSDVSLADGDNTSGNWIALDIVSSSLPREATLLIYATNADGEMIDRDGDVTSDLNQAVLGQVGAVATDQGTTLFNGTQSIYLDFGNELHFALKTGNDVVNADPLVQVTAREDGITEIEVGGVHLTASSGNTLSESSQMAAVQRTYDSPVVYLEQGQEVEVNVAGSAANTNSLYFVKVDVDPDTQEFEVDGIAFADSDEFRAAVLSHLDEGYSATYGGGNFNTTSTWTVAGDSGLYAPVLVTRGGEVFVMGDANSDGAEHIRTFGENIFGFEDLTAAQGSDFDFNDMVMQLTPHGFLI